MTYSSSLGGNAGKRGKRAEKGRDICQNFAADVGEIIWRLSVVQRKSGISRSACADCLLLNPELKKSVFVAPWNTGLLCDYI